MRYGITMFATDLAIDVVELAREAEARGLQSLWLPEHTHIPVSRRTPPPTLWRVGFWQRDLRAAPARCAHRRNLGPRLGVAAARLAYPISGTYLAR